VCERGSKCDPQPLSQALRADAQADEAKHFQLPLGHRQRRLSHAGVISPASLAKRPSIQHWVVGLAAPRRRHASFASPSWGSLESSHERGRPKCEWAGGDQNRRPPSEPPALTRSASTPAPRLAAPGQASAPRSHVLGVC
jgi:hypothetical protein